MRGSIGLAVASLLLLVACARPDHRLALNLADGATPLIELQINGTTSREFVLDTGASNTTILPADAEFLGLPRTGDGVGVGSTGNAAVTLYTIRELKAGRFAVRNLTVAAVPGPSFEGRNVTGLAGVDLFEGKVVTFDLPAGQARIHPPNTRPGKRWIAQKSQWLRPWKIMVPMTVNGVRSMGFLDTGAQHSVANPALARLAGLSPEPGEEAGGFSGLSGHDIRIERSRPAALTLGTKAIGTRAVHFADLPVFQRLLGAETPQMMVGMDLLRNLSFSIDYGSRIVWFEQE